MDKGTLNEWVTEWVNEWVSACVREWVSEWVHEWVSEEQEKGYNSNLPLSQWECHCPELSSDQPNEKNNNIK